MSQHVSSPYLINMQEVPAMMRISDHAPASSSVDQIATGPTSKLSLKALLQKIGIIDKAGMVIDEDKLPPFPALKSLDHGLIDGILNKNVTIQVGEMRAQVSLSDILKHVYFRTPGIVPNIELIGGFVRKTLLESPEFLMEVLTALTGMPPIELQPYVDEIIKKSKARDLPDIDIRIRSSIVSRDILCGFTQSVVDYIAARVQSSHYFVQRNAFSKFNVVYDDKNKFSIATINPLDSFEFELLFIAELKRNHLFSHDSLRLSILPHLLGSGTIALESDYSTPWQPILDLLTRTIHIPDLETVDIFGFPVLMSYYTRGYSSASADDVNQLEKKVTQLSQYHVALPGQITGLLSTTLRNHHQNDPLAAFALTVNTLMHMGISSSESTAIWEQMRFKYWNELELSKYPLLKAIDEVVTEHKIPFPEALASISVLGQGEPPITIPGTDYYLNPPGTPADAIDILAEYAHHNPEFKRLSPLLLETFSSKSVSESDILLEKGMELITSKCRSQRFLGFMTLLHVGGPETHCLLMDSFIDALTYMPKAHRSELMSRLDHSSSFKPLLLAFRKSYSPEQSESRQMLNWVSTLAGQKDTTKIAYALWMRFRNKYSSKVQAKINAVIVEASLPEDIEGALKLIEIGTQGANRIKPEATLSQLTIALPLAAHQKDVRFALLVDRVTDLVSYSLNETKTAPDNRFADALAQWIDRLIETENIEQAESLLDMSTKHPELSQGNPQMYHARLRLADLKRDNLKTFLSEWKKLEALGECPKNHQPLHQKVHFALATQLLEHAETEQEGYRQLRLLAEQSEPDPQLSPLAKRDVRELIDSDETGAAAKLVNDVYLKHLTPKAVLSLRKRLFHRFLREKKFSEAYEQWKAFHTLVPETNRSLIDALISGESEPKHLNAALRLIRKEISDKELSPQDKLTYFIAIFHKKKSLKLLGKIVTYAMETPACRPERIKVLRLFNGEMKQRKQFEQPFIDQMRIQLPEITDTLKEEHQQDLVEGIAKAFQSLGMPLIDFDLIRSQAESYIDTKNHKKALKWVRKASNQEELFVQWLPDLLPRYRQLIPEQEAELYQIYHASIQSLPHCLEHSMRADQLASSEESAVTTAVKLLNLYPPRTSASWNRVIKGCDPGEFPFVWKSFYAWLEGQPEVSSDLKDTVFAAIEHFCEIDESPVPELLKTLTSPGSPLGRLCAAESETLELRGKLLISYAADAKTPQLFSVLYDSIGTGLTLDEHMPAYRDLTIALVNILTLRKQREFSLYACEIFSSLAVRLPVHDSDAYCDSISQTLISLLDIVEKNKRLIESDGLVLLVYASSVIRANFKDHVPALDIADKLSLFNVPIALEECCGHLSNIPEDSPRKRKIWGQFLSRWLKENYDWESQLDIHNALEFYTENILELDYKSHEYIACSNIAFDLILKFLDRPATMAKYCELLETYFHTLFKARPVFATHHEIPLYPYKSPVFSCNDSCDKGDREFFFDRMTSLISKVLDRESLDPSNESYVHHFLTKNLWTLCDQFPEKAEKLVPLLDRFYFRYPPADNVFFPAHIAFAGKLLLFAIGKNIYDKHAREMTEAMLFLEMKTCLLEGRRLVDQAAILEHVIDRTLAFNAPSALLRAIYILQGTQRFIIKDNFGAIERIYRKLTDAIMIDPFYIFERSTLFEWVRMGLMHKETIIGFSKEEIALSTTSTLSETLFLKVFGIYQTPSLFENTNSYTRTALLEWLGKFLILSRQHGAYWDKNGVERYFRLAGAIVPEVANEYPKMNPNHKEHLCEIYTRVIIGEEFHQTHKLSKKQKSFRSEMMRNWLLKIVSTPDFCRKQLELAKSLKVFENNPKDYRKVDAKLKLKNH